MPWTSSRLPVTASVYIMSILTVCQRCSCLTQQGAHWCLCLVMVSMQIHIWLNIVGTFIYPQWVTRARPSVNITRQRPWLLPFSQPQVIACFTGNVGLRDPLQTQILVDWKYYIHEVPCEDFPLCFRIPTCQVYTLGGRSPWYHRLTEIKDTASCPVSRTR